MNHSVFRKILVSKIFMHRKGGGHHGFVEFFCLTVPKKFVREPFAVSENLGYRKIFCMRRIARLSVDYFMFHRTEIFVGESFSVSLISGIENFYAQKGYITIFCRKFFVSQYQKIS